MRKIKFKGETLAGKIVYGDLRHFGNELMIEEPTTGNGHYVKPETVSQLVGVDYYGREVYEGDKVVRFTGAALIFSMAATFEDSAAIRSGEIIKYEND